MSHAESGVPAVAELAEPEFVEEPAAAYEPEPEPAQVQQAVAEAAAEAEVEVEEPAAPSVAEMARRLMAQANQHKVGFGLQLAYKAPAAGAVGLMTINGANFQTQQAEGFVLFDAARLNHRLCCCALMPALCWHVAWIFGSTFDLVNY